MLKTTSFSLMTVMILFTGCGSNDKTSNPISEEPIQQEIKVEPTVKVTKQSTPIKRVPNKPPVASPQNITINKNSTKVITLSGADLDGDALTYTVVTPPTKGAFKNGVYTPNRDYVGSDSFTFKANDGKVDSLPATISIIVTDTAEVINGYTLPPEPDPKINNSTLLGIDSNSNGVRDDVERYIIKTYPKKLQVEILMDGAKTFQKIMEQSTGNATVLQKNFSRLIACEIYLMRLNKNLIPENFLFSRILKHIIVNNPDRVKKYLDYNIALSGGVYGNTSDAYKREACSQETITVLEEMGL